LTEENSATNFLIGVLLTIIVVGFFVLIVKPDYRFEQISLTNEEYYPNVPINREESTSSPEEADGP